MVLDPHRAFTKHPGGISINVVEEGAMYKDQLAPFTSIMQGEIAPFSGTAFRLPLRTSHQAARSRIRHEATDVAEVRGILQGFVANELESVILFLKHITSIEVRRIDPLGMESILGKVEIDRLDVTGNSGQAHQTVTLTMEDGNPTTRTWFFYRHHVKKDEATRLISSRLDHDIEDRLIQEKLTPGVEIAFPLQGPNIRGGLFTLLPLPINIPGSSFHLNATFALTPDRQNLKKKQEVGDRRSRER
jgi:sacsin